jgi:HD-like signal output (HDOD) protein
MTTGAAKATLLQRLEGLERIPTIPAALVPVLRYLQQPLEKLDAQQVSDLISRDKSLTAQCLQMASSPLFGRFQKVTSLHDAILGLGLQRVSDIVMSCCVLNMMPRDRGIDPVTLWEHSLGCALVARHFARKIAYPDPGKAYLAGLLHDLGLIVNLWVLPKEFKAVFEFAHAEGIPLHEAEHSMLGFTHCESGRLLAERWGLSEDLIEVVARHHSPQKAEGKGGLVALVELSDLLCRMNGLNYGYIERREVDLTAQPGFAVLAEECAGLKEFDWARLTFEMDSYTDDVHALVRTIYRT